MSEGAIGHETLRQLIVAGRNLLSHLELEPLLHRLLDGELERFVTSAWIPRRTPRSATCRAGAACSACSITDPQPLRLRNVGDHPRSLRAGAAL